VREEEGEGGEREREREREKREIRERRIYMHRLGSIGSARLFTRVYARNTRKGKMGFELSGT